MAHHTSCIARCPPGARDVVHTRARRDQSFNNGFVALLSGDEQRRDTLVSRLRGDGRRVKNKSLRILIGETVSRGRALLRARAGNKRAAGEQSLASEPAPKRQKK